MYASRSFAKINQYTTSDFSLQQQTRGVGRLWRKLLYGGCSLVLWTRLTTTTQALKRDYGILYHQASTSD